MSATDDRALINKALWLFRPTTEQGRAVGDLVRLTERLLAGRDASTPTDDEAAIRRQIDDPASAVLVWADVLEEKGEDQAVCEKLRWLAREGKWPGRTGGLYRWSAERPEFGGGASWTLPPDTVTILMTKSIHLGGKEKGRFPTASAALLAAARVLAAREPYFTPEVPAEEATPSAASALPPNGTPALPHLPANCFGLSRRDDQLPLPDLQRPLRSVGRRWHFGWGYGSACGRTRAALVDAKNGEDMPCTCGGLMHIFRNRWGGASAFCRNRGCDRVLYSTAEDR